MVLYQFYITAVLLLQLYFPAHAGNAFKLKFSIFILLFLIVIISFKNTFEMYCYC